ncbi:MAG TPA: diaminopimelate epimerase [Anaerovoracaceae bacterium]|nr:diaminopimelate epimerase [Anaerovoracaceae bacterium]
MIRFSKYHGCGNDFVILTEEDAGGRPYPELAEEICHRQLGVGADGLIIVRQEPLEMIYFNSDGSRAPMCGNGIRCFAKYCFDEGICSLDEYPVETLAGTMRVRIVSREPFLVEISMGKPDFDPKRCGIKTDRGDFLRQKLQLRDGDVEVSSCFMGTIHTVVWLDDPEAESAGLEGLGREICGHPVFTDQTNVNFVRVLDRKTLKLTTYERGAGMTLACGTGACASVVIGALEGRCDGDAVVLLPFGKLHIVQKPDDEVMMTGPAVRTARGYFE